MALRAKPDAKPVSDAFGHPIDDDSVYVCTVNFSSDLPRRGTTVPLGERLRGDHPVVLAHSERFVPDGVPRREWPDRMKAIYEASAVVQEQERQELERLYGERGTLIQPAPADRVEVNTEVLIDVGGRSIRLTAGEYLPSKECLVQAGVAKTGLRRTA